MLQAKEQAEYNKAQKAKEALEAEGGDDMAKAAQFLQMTTAKLTKARPLSAPASPDCISWSLSRETLWFVYPVRTAQVLLESWLQQFRRSMSLSCLIGCS